VQQQLVLLATSVVKLAIGQIHVVCSNLSRVEVQEVALMESLLIFLLPGVSWVDQLVILMLILGLVSSVENVAIGHEIALVYQTVD
jgi:hypothetical protein